MAREFGCEYDGFGSRPCANARSELRGSPVRQRICGARLVGMLCSEGVYALIAAINLAVPRTLIARFML